MRWRTGTAFGAGLVLLNLLLYLWVRGAGFLLQPFDIQSRRLYQIRLDQVYAATGKEKLVFLGDSVIYGGKLEEEHGSSWRRYTLPAQFADLLQRRYPGRFEVINLGINGVLFRDLDRIVRDILPARPRWLIMDVSMRPFSSDFSAPAGSSARLFLHDEEAAAAPLGLNLSSLDGILGRIVPALGYRDLLQFRYLGETPSGYLDKMIRSWAQRGNGEEDDLLEREIMPRLKAAERYNSISVERGRLQARYLTRMLRTLAAAGRPRTLLFYLGEDLEKLGDAVDARHYEEQLAQFKKLVQDGIPAGSGLAFVWFETGEFAEYYDDHIHLNAAGYRRLAERLLDRVSRDLEGHAED